MIPQSRTPQSRPATPQSRPGTPHSRSTTPHRRPPPPSRSISLQGMEKVIPPKAPSQTSPLSPAADTEKPLPRRPRQTSSVYSDDSGYTKLIELYENWQVDEVPLSGIAVEPAAYRTTLNGMLARRFGSMTPPISQLTVPKYVKPSISIPSLRLTPDNLPSSDATDVKHAPSFLEFSKSMTAVRSEMVSPLSSLTSSDHTTICHEKLLQPELKASPEFRAIVMEHERQHLSDQVSPRITDVVDSQFMPPSLDFSRTSKIYNGKEKDTHSAQRDSYIIASEQRSNSRFSYTSSSEDSFVVYTGVRETVRAMIRTRLGNKKDPHSKDRDSPHSIAGVDNPLTESKAYEPEKKTSRGSSKRSSVQQGVSNLLRSMSVNKTSIVTEHSHPKPRVRQKQLAIPLSSYQKYGPTIWHNSERKKRRQAGATRQPPLRSPTKWAGIQRWQTQHRGKAPPPRHGEVLTAFQSGRSQLLIVLDGKKHKMTKTNSQKKREDWDKSITRADPSEQHERGRPTNRTTSERRRDRLKKTITLIGPRDPFVVNWDTASGPDQYQQIDREAEYWL